MAGAVEAEEHRKGTLNRADRWPIVTDAALRLLICCGRRAAENPAFGELDRQVLFRTRFYFDRPTKFAPEQIVAIEVARPLPHGTDLTAVFDFIGQRVSKTRGWPQERGRRTSSKPRPRPPCAARRARANIDDRYRRQATNRSSPLRLH
jgi:hypothetical protein